MYNATKEQMDLIKSTEGFIRCGAVPGSGKTFSITHRMAYLIRELYVEPSSIVALTFTNKAAASMTRRLKELIGDEATCFTGTFHGFCNKLLKEEIYRLSYPKTFTILDKKDQIDLIREVAEELHLSLKDFNAKNYMEKIGICKLREEYITLLKGNDKSELMNRIENAEDDFLLVYYNYLLKQRDNYVLDFDDIINFAIYILENYKEALEKWQDRCQYILCDEYQDVNMRQNQLLNLLSGKFHNLTVVGDDDQCIYGWRGSKVDYMVNFHEQYNHIYDYFLSENFRSTPEIVGIANSLIVKNQNRLEKKMFTNNPSGEKPIFNNLKTERDEALWIADTITSAVLRKSNSENKKSYFDHVVLVRASSQTRALEEAFIQKKIPYKILNGAQFYSSEEIKTVLAYLRMIYSTNDMDFVWTIQHPRRGFGKKSLEDLKLYAKEREIKLFEALGQWIEQGLVKKQSIIDYYNGIIKLHSSYEDYSAKGLVNAALDIGYRAELEQDVDQRKLDNVSEFILTISSLEEENQDRLGLSELLAHFALFSGQDDDTAKDVVRVMTIHTAKGLEFDTVFVNGLVGGQFPSKRLHNEDEMEEERRLFYVAITRAKKKLYLSSYELKGGAFPAHQSEFLGELDVKLLNCINDSRIISSSSQTPLVPKTYFNVGDEVTHPVFGEGTIVSVNEEAQNYDIDFKKLEGIRRIQFRAVMKKE